MNNNIIKALEEVVIEEMNEFANDNKVSLDRLYVYDVDFKSLGGEMHFDIFQADFYINIQDRDITACVYIASTEEFYAKHELKRILNNHGIGFEDF